MTMEFKWDKEGSGDPRGVSSEDSGTEGVSQKAEGGGQKVTEMERSRA